MNSLNIITARVSPSSSPSQSRSNSISSSGSALDEKFLRDADDAAAAHDCRLPTCSPHQQSQSLSEGDEEKTPIGEETALLAEHGREGRRAHWWHSLPHDLASNVIGCVRWILATLASPGIYLTSWLCDDEGNFAPMRQLQKLLGLRRNERGPEDPGPTAGRAGLRSYPPAVPSRRRLRDSLAPWPVPASSSSVSGALSSESEGDEGAQAEGSGHARSKSLGRAASSDAGPERRSIRIKLQGDEALRQRRHQRTQSAASVGSKNGREELSARLKSPTSPMAALTKYPRAPAPPRPLIPRRQPSYLNVEGPVQSKRQKTLILDLDETLIHSMSKGGKMSTGHMVEVRLSAASLGIGPGGGGGGGGVASQHPILYWVNKRPYCDEFLRRVCKWFNLVIFTASVQEYADPVIDWLESERKFFSARYYRQHCTYRQGAYIKDLSSVEPDLSKVMILDNSPLSYLFHQDNAIPIQGWINDPTDNDLMHLVPLLEGLQYVHDVRALLALRGGEDGHHTG